MHLQLQWLFGKGRCSSRDFLFDKLKPPSSLNSKKRKQAHALVSPWNSPFLFSFLSISLSSSSSSSTPTSPLFLSFIHSITTFSHSQLQVSTNSIHPTPRKRFLVCQGIFPCRNRACAFISSNATPNLPYESRTLPTVQSQQPVSPVIAAQC